MNVNDNRFQPVDFFPCPICLGPVQESWCPCCKANTIINWGLPVEGKP